MKLNSNFLNLHESYLFSEVAQRAAAYQREHPKSDLIKLSIGDVSRPLAPSVIEAMRLAVEDLSRAETFRGYAPERYCYGYELLLEAILNRYARRKIGLKAEEIFISDGAKSDLGNLLDLFSTENEALLPDPVYPAYADANIMSGRRIRYLRGDEGNRFLPMPDGLTSADLIYLCSPNNPTGAAYSLAQLREWVKFAQRTGAVILYDAAYEAFVRERSVARSIYEVEGAEECAIEVCSFSKTAGFTGVRCGYTIVPKTLIRDGISLNGLWRRRQSTKFNGASYLAQMGAAAAFSEAGERETRENLNYYRENAKIIGETLSRLGIFYTGGINSPYIWMKCPQKKNSWEFFDELLQRANVIGTPGSGFGEGGEGFFRLTAFNTLEKTQEACRRIERLLAR